MPNGFKTPDFKKDTVRDLCEKIWMSGIYEFKKLNKRVKDLEGDAGTVKIDMADIKGQLKIIIYMGGGMLTLLIAVLAIIAGGE